MNSQASSSSCWSSILLCHLPDSPLSIIDKPRRCAQTHTCCCDQREFNTVACVCFEGLGLRVCVCVCEALCLCVCVSSCRTIRGSLLHCCTTNRWPLPYCKKLNTRQGPLSISEAKPQPHHNTVISVLSLTSIMKYCKCFPLNGKKDTFIAARYLWADTALEWFRGLFLSKTLP